MKRVALIVVFAAGLLAACSPPFPRQLLDQVSKKVSFDALRAEPEAYRGTLLMLGGMIVDAKNLKEGTRIEVLQKPLDGQGRPLDTDETGGRFVIMSEQFLDAAVYRPGRLVTVIGESAGSRTLPLGETEYRYPEITAKSLHLWSPYSGPRFSFGVGVYRGF